MKTIDEHTLYGRLARQKALRPDKPFFKFVDTGAEYTWRQAHDKAEQLARGYLALGVKKGEHVVLWGPNSARWVLHFLALASIGAVAVLANAGYKRMEMAHLLRNADANVLVMGRRNRDIDYVKIIRELVPELGPRAGGPLVSRAFPALRQVLCFEAGHAGMMHAAMLPELGRRVPPARLREARAAVAPQDILNIQYTSGTTGKPKGVMAGHGAAFFNAACLVREVPFLARDTVLNPLPLYHTFGLTGALLCALVSGHRSLIMGGFEPQAVLRAVQREKATLLMGVPTMYTMLINRPDLPGYDLSSLQKGIIAGALCSAGVITAMSEVLGIGRPINIYGLTEAIAAVTLTHADAPHEKLLHTVGRPMEGFEVRVVDIETRRPLPPGEQGEVLVRSQSQMAGYHNDPEATAACLDSEGWLATGDIGRFDGDGDLIITGRAKELINRGGENIYPKEVEMVVLEHPAVQEAQVIGIPSALYGEEVAACVKLKDGMRADAGEIRQFVRERVAFYKAPKEVYFCNSFPMTGTGKIQKHLLRQQVLAGVSV